MSELITVNTAVLSALVTVENFKPYTLIAIRAKYCSHDL